MKKSVLIQILLLFLYKSIYGQGFIIEGHLLDKKDNPIPYANIYLEINTEIGTLTDDEGNFKLELKKSIVEGNDEITIIFSALGFKTKKSTFSLSGQSNPAIIFLEEESQILDEVLLSSDSNASKEYTVLTLNKIDIYSNPSASADPLLAIQIYPYATNTDETANPSFRGSNADKSRVLLNGVPVFSPVRNNQINGLGNFSLFNTEMLDKQLIFPSNPPLIYGNSSAGIVEIETAKDVNDSYQASLSMASAGFLMSKTLKKNNFIQLYGNKQFSNLFLDINGNNIELLKDFSSLDAGLNIRLTNENNSYVNVFSYIINESFEADTSILNTTSLNNSSRTRFFTVANYVNFFEEFKMTLNSGYDYSRSPSKFANIDLISKDISYYSSLNFSFNVNNIFLKTGVNYNLLERTFNGTFPVFSFGFTNESPTSLINNSTKTNILESYLYGKVRLNDFIFSLGLRKNIPLSHRVNDISFKDDYLSYQTFIRWNLNKYNNFIFSAGQYHSYGNPNIVNQRIALNSSFQTSLDYTYEKNDTKIKASIYTKKETGLTNNSFELVDNIVDDRTIYGFEAQFNKNIFKELKFNVSYSFINSKLVFDGETFRASNDLNYFIKGALIYYKKGWNFSLTSISRPGTYYTDVVSSSFNSEAMTFEPIFSDSFNSQQLKNYLRLDFSINKTIELKNNNRLISFCSINNLLDRKNDRNIVFNANYTSTTPEFFPERLLFFGIVYLFN